MVIADGSGGRKTTISTLTVDVDAVARRCERDETRYYGGSEAGYAQTSEGRLGRRVLRG